MARVSVLIPSRNERFLTPTIRSLLERSAGDIEIVATLDGYWPDEIVDDPRVKYLHRGVPLGMRAGINAARQVATGEFLLKTDGHCLFGEGYDEILQADCDQDWVVVARRKRLDAENWCVQEVGKPDIDYMYLSYPDDPADFGGPGLNGKLWEERNADPELKKVEIDDLMSAQGSSWFMPAAYFDRLELMDDRCYGTFWNEFQEIGLKAWLSGGQVKVNKRTWYAHLHKGKTYGRGYPLGNAELRQGRDYTQRWLGPVGHAWHKQTLPLSWLIEKFWPVPTWPERRELWEPHVFATVTD